MYSYTYRQSGAVCYATKKAGLFAITRKGDSARSHSPQINCLARSTQFVVLTSMLLALSTNTTAGTLALC